MNKDSIPSGFGGTKNLALASKTPRSEAFSPCWSRRMVVGNAVMEQDGKLDTVINIGLTSSII